MPEEARAPTAFPEPRADSPDLETSYYPSSPFPRKRSSFTSNRSEASRRGFSVTLSSAWSSIGVPGVGCRRRARACERAGKIILAPLVRLIGSLSPLVCSLSLALLKRARSNSHDSHYGGYSFAPHFPGGKVRSCVRSVVDEVAPLCATAGSLQPRSLRSLGFLFKTLSLLCKTCSLL